MKLGGNVKGIGEELWKLMINMWKGDVSKDWKNGVIRQHRKEEGEKEVKVERKQEAIGYTAYKVYINFLNEKLKINAEKAS